MAEDYRGTERCITADNFFSFMAVVRELLDLRLTYCGTVRKSRREVPFVAKNLNMVRDEDLFLYNTANQVTLLRHKTSGSKFVLLISSAHYSNTFVTVQSRSGPNRIPEIIEAYNCNKIGVDVADQMLGNYTCQYPTKRWPMKLFPYY